MDPNELISVSLSERERFLLRCGVVEWGGPARCTEEMAVALGFSSVQALFDDTDRLVPALESGRPLSRLDWLRVLLATEVVFASNTLGSGIDWSITTGLPDDETIQLLRAVQRALTGKVVGLVGHGFGTSPLREHGTSPVKWSTGRTADVPASVLSVVSTSSELSEVVQAMRSDLSSHPGEWENATLADFLDGLAAWLTDMGDERLAQAPSWADIAAILVAASGYE